MDLKEKDVLFYGSHDKRWYNAPLTEKPSDEIETPFGRGKLTVQDDYSISLDIHDLHTIWGVTYKIKGTLKLNSHTETWWFNNHTMRAKAIERDYSGRNWTSLTPSSPTDKARQKINDTLKPILEEWAENNWQQLSKGKTIGYVNKIEQARAKIADLQKQLDMRSQWLDSVESDFKKTGAINEHDERFDLYGRYWRFD